MGMFDGAPFQEQGSVTPLPAGDAVGSITETQGGPVLQGPLTPRAIDTVQIPGQGTPAEYLALRAKRWVTGDLTWGITTTWNATATLLGISGPSQTHPSTKVLWTMTYRIEDLSL